jgi:glycoside hydrolase-like protein
MVDGIDCATDCTKRIATIKQMSAEFVGRYYRLPGSKWDALTATEAKALSHGALTIVSLWESRSDALDHFSHGSGVDEGTSAYRQTMKAGQPPRTPIYFAVDFDCSDAGIAGAVNDYFRGVADGFSAIGVGNPAYDIGVYGSGNTCGWLLTHGLVKWTWMALSTGWGGFKTFKDWNIKQIAEVKKPFDHDTDEARSDYGGW